MSCRDIVISQCPCGEQDLQHNGRTDPSRSRWFHHLSSTETRGSHRKEGTSHLRTTAARMMRWARPVSWKLSHVQKGGVRERVGEPAERCRGVGVACELSIDEVGAQGAENEPAPQRCAGGREVCADECDRVRRSQLCSVFKQSQVGSGQGPAGRNPPTSRTWAHDEEQAVEGCGLSQCAPTHYSLLHRTHSRRGPEMHPGGRTPSSGAQRAQQMIGRDPARPRVGTTFHEAIMAHRSGQAVSKWSQCPRGGKQLLTIQHDPLTEPNAVGPTRRSTLARGVQAKDPLLSDTTKPPDTETTG